MQASLNFDRWVGSTPSPHWRHLGDYAHLRGGQASESSASVTYRQKSKQPSPGFDARAIFLFVALNLDLAKLGDGMFRGLCLALSVACVMGVGDRAGCQHNNQEYEHSRQNNADALPHA